MFSFVVVIHIITCILLITVILMQSGKGGGLTETFSGAESIFGTKTNAFMLRATSVLAIIFLFTCISLALMSTQRSRSLIESELLTTKKSGAKSQQQTKPAGQNGTKAAATTAKATQPLKAEIPAVNETKPLEQTNQKNIVSGKESTQTK